MIKKGGFGIVGIVISVAVIGFFAYGVYALQFGGKDSVSVDGASSLVQQAEDLKDSLEEKNNTTEEAAKDIIREYVRDTKGNFEVTYSPEGFDPSVLKVKAGQAVVFKNVGNQPLKIAPNTFSTTTNPLGASPNQGASMGKGESFTFTFTEKGVWGYKNVNKENHLGVIVVE